MVSLAAGSLTGLPPAHNGLTYLLEKIDSYTDTLITIAVLKRESRKRDFASRLVGY